MANVRYPGTAGTTPGTITAADVTYDNTTSGLTADDVQEAIDEVDSNVDTLSSTVTTLSGKVYKTDDSTETTIASDDLLPIYDTSATASKKITVENVVKATVSNPNLLDNPWFTVNQRGQSSYTTSASEWNLTVDRWLSGPNNTVTKNSDNSISLGHLDFFQILSADINLAGKTITLSCLVDNEIISGTYTVRSTFPSTFIADYVILPSENSKHIGMYFGYTNEGTCFSIAFYNPDSPSYDTSSLHIKAVKLEVGSVSTLALDTVPNYATELLKCQRYFVRLSPSMQYANGVIGFAPTNDSLRFPWSLPIPMRTLPTITYSSLSDIVYTRSTASAGTSPSALTINSMAGNNVCINMNGTFTAGDIYMSYFTNANAYIDLSADL